MLINDEILQENSFHLLYLHLIELIANNSFDEVITAVAFRYTELIDVGLQEIKKKESNPHDYFFGIQVGIFTAYGVHMYEHISLVCLSKDRRPKSGAIDHDRGLPTTEEITQTIKARLADILGNFNNYSQF